MSAPALPTTERHARLGRYALWQAGDFVLNIGIITIVLFALLGAIALMNLSTQQTLAIVQHRTVPLAMKINTFREIYTMFVMVAPIIVLTGVISQDRSAGYTRFLFAKPVSVRRFYLQSILVRFAGYLVVGQLLVLWYGAYQPPAYTLRFIADLSIGFVAVGGIVILFSALSKYDGLVAIVFLLIASIVWDTWERATGLKHAVTYLLPPVGKIGEVHLWLLGLNHLGNLADVPFPTKWALWTAGYGLACALLGLYLLRRIPLTKA